MNLGPEAVELLDKVLPDLVTAAITGAGGFVVGAIVGWVRGRRRERVTVRERLREDELKKIDLTRDYFVTGLRRITDEGAADNASVGYDARLLSDSLYEKVLRGLIDLWPDRGDLSTTQHARIEGLCGQIAQSMAQQRDRVQRGQPAVYTASNSAQVYSLLAQFEDLLNSGAAVHTTPRARDTR